MSSSQTETHFLSLSYIVLILSCNLSTSRSTDSESDLDFDKETNPFNNEFYSTSENETDFPNATMWSLGGALLPSDYPRERIKRMYHEDQPIPNDFDARKKWPECPSIGEIWHQGKCGSCWAVATSMMLTDRMCIASNESETFVYSAEDLLSCCSSCIPKGKTDACKKGGVVAYALKYWTTKGVVSGGDLNSGQGCKPYKLSTFKGKSSPCVESCTNLNYSVSYSNDKQFGVDITEFKFPMRVKHLQTEIMTNGPVVAMMKATSHFEKKYHGGVYQKPSFFTFSSTWHAVRIIGWGEDSGVPYWLVANSWGKEWGMEGFFKILRGYNHLSIEKAVLAGHFNKVSSSRMIEASKNILGICIVCLLILCF